MTTLNNFGVKFAGTWKFGTPYVKSAGTWKAVQTAWVKSGGVWKQVFGTVASGGPTWSVTDKSSHVVLSNGNLTAKSNPAGGYTYGFVRSSTGYRDTGVDHIATITIEAMPNGWHIFSLVDSSGDVTGNIWDVPDTYRVDVGDGAVYGRFGDNTFFDTVVPGTPTATFRIRLNGTNFYLKQGTSAELGPFDVSHLTGNIYLAYQPGDGPDGDQATANFSQWAAG